MGETTLKVILEPDTRKLDKELKGKKLGLGVDSATGAGKKGKGIEIAGFGKLLGFAGIAATVLSALDFVLSPILNLL